MLNLAKKLMKMLNRSGAEVMKKYDVKGATDITGFGLAGHALKMAKASNVTMLFNLTEVPLIGDTYRLVDEGCIPGASFRNLEFVENDSHLTIRSQLQPENDRHGCPDLWGIADVRSPEVSENVTFRPSYSGTDTNQL